MPFLYLIVAFYWNKGNTGGILIGERADQVFYFKYYKCEIIMVE